MHINNDDDAINSQERKIVDEDEEEFMVSNEHLLHAQHNNGNNNNWKLYIESETTGREASKRKREAKQRIDKDMKAQNQSVVQYDERYFVRESAKRQKAALTMLFVEKGIVAFLRDVKHMQNVSDDVGREFVQYLDQKREKFATVSKPRIVCTKKRPIDGYFGAN